MDTGGQWLGPDWQGRHFPGDVVAGGAMGWFIGDYVYTRRHNGELDQKRTITKRILDHIPIGGPVY